MIKSIVASIALLPFLAVGVAAESPEPNKLITILTSSDPQTQLMAMVLTMNAIKSGASADILLCGPAAGIALRDAPPSATAGQPPMGASPQGVMQLMMTQMNVDVRVCAIYLPSIESDASVLIDGVTAAAPDAMGAAIVAPRTTVMSF